MRFKVKRDFHSPELKSQYVKGLSYMVRPGNDLLAKMVPQWLSEGKIETLDSPQVQVEIKATGKVE
jgi:hypothetical protein